MSNAPTEAINRRIKGIKRIEVGFRRFAHCGTRVLRYADKPDCGLLAIVHPR